MRILLVDDSSTIRSLQRTILEQLGYDDIAEAGDGVEALKSIAGQRPDLMIVDWNMPNMDGIMLVRTVRAMDKTLPIIMCTTEAEKARVIEAVKAGINDYLIKPFTAAALSEKIERIQAKIVAAT